MLLVTEYHRIIKNKTEANTLIFNELFNLFTINSFFIDFAMVILALFVFIN